MAAGQGAAERRWWLWRGARLPGGAGGVPKDAGQFIPSWHASGWDGGTGWGGSLRRGC